MKTVVKKPNNYLIEKITERITYFNTNLKYYFQFNSGLSSKENLKLILSMINDLSKNGIDIKRNVYIIINSIKENLRRSNINSIDDINLDELYELRNDEHFNLLLKCLLELKYFDGYNDLFNKFNKYFSNNQSKFDFIYNDHKNYFYSLFYGEADELLFTFLFCDDVNFDNAKEYYSKNYYIASHKIEEYKIRSDEEKTIFINNAISIGMNIGSYYYDDLFNSISDQKMRLSLFDAYLKEQPKENLDLYSIYSVIELFVPNDEEELDLLLNIYPYILNNKENDISSYFSELLFNFNLIISDELKTKAIIKYLKYFYDNDIKIGLNYNFFSNFENIISNATLLESFELFKYISHFNDDSYYIGNYILTPLQNKIGSIQFKADSKENIELLTKYTSLLLDILKDNVKNNYDNISYFYDNLLYYIIEWTKVDNFEDISTKELKENLYQFVCSSVDYSLYLKRYGLKVYVPDILSLLSDNSYYINLINYIETNVNNNDKYDDESKKTFIINSCTTILNNYKFNTEEDINTFFEIIDSLKKYDIFNYVTPTSFSSITPNIFFTFDNLLKNSDLNGIDSITKKRIIDYCFENTSNNFILSFCELLKYCDDLDSVINYIRKLYSFLPDSLGVVFNDKLLSTKISEILSAVVEKINTEEELNKLIGLFDLNSEFQAHSINLDYNKIMKSFTITDNKIFSYNGIVLLATRFYDYYLENILKPNNTPNVTEYDFTDISYFASKLSTFDEKYSFVTSFMRKYQFKRRAYNDEYDGHIGVNERFSNIGIFDLNTDADSLISQIKQYMAITNLSKMINLRNMINSILYSNNKIDKIEFLNKIYAEVKEISDNEFEEIVDAYLYNIPDEDKLKTLFGIKKYFNEPKLVYTHLKSFFGYRSYLDETDIDILSNIITEDFINRGFAIANLFIDRNYDYNENVDENITKSFIEDEREYYKTGRIKDLIKKYYKIGVITDTELHQIYETLSKYGFHSYEDFINKISSNSNFKSIFDKGIYDRELIDKMILLYPKLRYKAMFNTNLLSYMSLDMCKKFDLKTWNKLRENPLFGTSPNTDKHLIELIEFAGLFENDAEVENRRKMIYSLLNVFNNKYYTNDIDLRQDLEYLEPVKEIGYRLLNPNNIPEGLEGYLLSYLTSNDMRRLKKRTGAVGSKINKFLYPYDHQGNDWHLKRDVDISSYPELKPIMTDEEMRNVLTSPLTRNEVLAFLNPYIEEHIDCYRFKKNIPKEILDKFIIRDCSTFNIESICRVFNKLDVYDPVIFEFFLENIDLIMKNPETQKTFNIVAKKYYEIKGYFASRGNSNPNYNDFFTYVTSLDFIPEYGNEEFAREVRLANGDSRLSDEEYRFYEDILKITRQRKLSTVPRHNKTYEIIAPNGKKYTILTKMLRSDDYLNLLVGEDKFTGCCQCYGNAGQSCMEHASTSQNGAIFVTYLIVDGKESLLTQSWTWTNESKLCFDNIEASGEFKDSDERDSLSYVIKEAYSLASKDIIEYSELKVEEYYNKEKNRILNSSLPEEEKQKLLRELEEVRARQKIKTVTVGTHIDDDVRATETFMEIDDDEESMLPKGYSGYSDAKNGDQRVITKIEGAKPVSSKFKEVPIYRDERQTFIESGSSIKQSTLKKISDIESIAHKNEMINYTHGKDYLLFDASNLAQIYSCDVESLRIIHGEDWYYVYSVTDDSIEVFDLAKGEPRLKDESMNQTIEMSSAFNSILKDAIIFNDKGEVVGIKEISADLREDTSYPLFLIQIKRGIIEQIGDDVVYTYENGNDRRVVDKEEQKVTLSKMKQIKKEGNPNINMHRVKFKPTKKTIEQLYGKELIEGREL